MQIVLDERRKQRLRYAEAYRAGREIDIVHVLGPRGVGLSASIAPKVLELFPGLVAEQVLDCMEDRARMGLHRHSVFRSQDREIKRGHDSGEGRRRRLMPPYFKPVLIVANVIRVMNDPRGKPQNLSL